MPIPKDQDVTCTSTIVTLAALHMGWLKFLAVFLRKEADREGNDTRQFDWRTIMSLISNNNKSLPKLVYGNTSMLSSGRTTAPLW